MATNRIALITSARVQEHIAGAAFSPGHLLEYASDGDVQKHSTEGDYALRLIALEDALQGNIISTAYAAADRAQVLHAVPGDKVQMMLNAGENVAIGDVLISDGAGALIAEGSASSGVTVKQAIAIAREALDLSASGAVDTLIDVEII